MADEIKVEAETINPPALLTGAERWLAAASEKVAERAELYRPPEQIESASEFKSAKDARAQVRRDFAELDSERKAMTRQLEDSLKKFRSEVKDVLSPLSDLDVQYKALIDSYEESLAVQRRIDLVQEYEDLAPALMELVPFDRLEEKFGREKGKVWLRYGTNIEVAKRSLADAIEKVADGEKTIGEMVPEEDLVETKSEYFRTLDLMAALRAAKEAKERRERVEQLERERQEWSAQAEPEPAPEPAPVPEPAPIPVQAPTPAPTPSPAYEDAKEWVIVVRSATREQMMATADYMRNNGVVFSAIYCGSIQDAYMKETSNGR